MKKNILALLLLAVAIPLSLSAMDGEVIEEHNTGDNGNQQDHSDGQDGDHDTERGDDRDTTTLERPRKRGFFDRIKSWFGRGSGAESPVSMEGSVDASSVNADGTDSASIVKKVAEVSDSRGLDFTNSDKRTSTQRLKTDQDRLFDRMVERNKSWQDGQNDDDQTYKNELKASRDNAIDEFMTQTNGEMTMAEIRKSPEELQALRSRLERQLESLEKEPITGGTDENGEESMEDFVKQRIDEIGTKLEKLQRPSLKTDQDRLFDRMVERNKSWQDGQIDDDQTYKNELKASRDNAIDEFMRQTNGEMTKAESSKSPEELQALRSRLERQWGQLQTESISGRESIRDRRDGKSMKRFLSERIDSINETLKEIETKKEGQREIIRQRNFEQTAPRYY